MSKPNRLIHEKSPYLLQHAYNPVDWHPWGEEAFSKARRENKLIFLSIGYSTCHWCHVMEEESFSNSLVADILNKHFLTIKVDREERPDVDKIYMTFVQAITGSGGWPLSVWLTPDLKPVFGGTYFPPYGSKGRPGFIDILKQLAELWDSKQAELALTGEDIFRAVSQGIASSTSVVTPGLPENDLFRDAFKAFEASYDRVNGGFSSAPKFPMPVNLNYLLRYYAVTKDIKALELALQTLDKMSCGGIYDHIGGGFHRYSTDSRWHVPHFEKMLYDNAQIIGNYLEAYQITHNECWAAVARETLGYLLRDMARPEGGFYSAEDADSLAGGRKMEGAFYVWVKEEIISIAGKEAGERFCYLYGVKPNGDNVLHLVHAFDENDVIKIQEVKHKLFDARQKRPRPHLDDKILVSWNGLMLTALSKAFQVLGENKYLEAAVKTAGFIQKELYNAQSKRLYRRWREGERKIPGIADDYTFLVQGLIDLYESSFDANWLLWAIELTDVQNELFYDAGAGGFYMTASDHDKNLLLRVKDDSDGVEPAASSVAVLNLLRLAQFTDRKDLKEAAEKTIHFFSRLMQASPRSWPQMLAALGFYLHTPEQIVIAGKPQAPDTIALVKEVHSSFVPHKILMLCDTAGNQELLARFNPFLKNIKPINGKATAYICVNYACEIPVSEPDELSRLLKKYEYPFRPGNS